MKALHDRMQNLQGETVANDLAARVAVIFQRYPMLCGFSVQERSTMTMEGAMAQLQDGLCLADVTVNTAPGFRVTQEFCHRIAYALLELLHDQPEAFELLPGRTFARTLH